MHTCQEVLYQKVGEYKIQGEGEEEEDGDLEERVFGGEGELIMNEDGLRPRLEEER